MSPLGIKRLVAFILVLSPWIFTPGLLKDVVFIIAGVFLFVSTLDLRKKTVRNHEREETESLPREAYSRSVEPHSHGNGAISPPNQAPSA